MTARLPAALGCHHAEQDFFESPIVHRDDLARKHSLTVSVIETTKQNKTSITYRATCPIIGHYLISATFINVS